jgi:hypothetical protein
MEQEMNIKGATVNGRKQMTLIPHSCHSFQGIWLVAFGKNQSLASPCQAVKPRTHAQYVYANRSSQQAECGTLGSLRTPRERNRKGLNPVNWAATTYSANPDQSNVQGKPLRASL